MKKQIIIPEPKPAETLTLDEVFRADEHVYICVEKGWLTRGGAKPTLWIMRFEKAGFVFRYWDSEAGQAGFFDSAQECIRAALAFGPVYQFNHHAEANTYIQSLQF